MHFVLVLGSGFDQHFPEVLGRVFLWSILTNGNSGLEKPEQEVRQVDNQLPGQCYQLLDKCFEVGARRLAIKLLPKVNKSDTIPAKNERDLVPGHLEVGISL